MCWVPVLPLEHNKGSSNVVSGERYFKHHAGKDKLLMCLGVVLVFCFRTSGADECLLCGRQSRSVWM